MISITHLSVSGFIDAFIRLSALAEAVSVMAAEEAVDPLTTLAYSLANPYIAVSSLLTGVLPVHSLEAHCVYLFTNGDQPTLALSARLLTKSAFFCACSVYAAIDVILGII